MGNTQPSALPRSSINFGIGLETTRPAPCDLLNLLLKGRDPIVNITETSRQKQSPDLGSREAAEAAGKQASSGFRDFNVTERATIVGKVPHADTAAVGISPDRC